MESLACFRDEGRTVWRATDAGCGSGVETLYLLRQGVAVHAFDARPDAIKALRRAAGPTLQAHLIAEVATFRSVRWRPDADLVFAGYSLPFASAEELANAWPRLVGSLRPGGRFAGNFFGMRDSWAHLPGRSHHSRGQLESLLRPHFAVEVFRETEEDNVLPDGSTKHWHVYDVIAQRFS